MFYEERIISGILHWRGTPDGEWIAKTAEQLTAMLQKEQEMLRTMSYLVQKLPNVLSGINND